MAAHLQKVTESDWKLLQRIVEIKKEHSAYETKSFKTNNALKTIVGSFDSEIWYESNLTEIIRQIESLNQINELNQV